MLHSKAQSTLGNKWVEEYGPTFKYKGLFSVSLFRFCSGRCWVSSFIDYSSLHFRWQSFTPHHDEHIWLPETRTYTWPSGSYGRSWSSCGRRYLDPKFQFNDILLTMEVCRRETQTTGTIVSSFTYLECDSDVCLSNVQRKIMVKHCLPSAYYGIDLHPWQNPAFGPAQIRELTEIFVEKSIQVSTCSRIANSNFSLELAPRYLAIRNP